MVVRLWVVCTKIIIFNSNNISRRIAAVCTVIISQAVVSDAYITYATKIPNGGFVLNPCDNSSWLGVGHKVPLGRGVRNPFGMKFAEANKVRLVTILLD